MTLTLEHRIILAEMAVREAERKLEELRDERQRGLVPNIISYGEFKCVELTLLT